MSCERILLLHGRTPQDRTPLAQDLSRRINELQNVVAFSDGEELTTHAPRICAPGNTCLVVVDPDVAAPFAAAHRISRVAPEVRILFAVDPLREETLRREAVYRGPPGGRWSLLIADHPELETRIAAELRLAAQQQRMRTTLDRMKLRLATPAPATVDSGEYRRLIASDRYLASVLHNAHDAIISVDLQGAIVSWNSGAERLFRTGAATARGKLLVEMFRDRTLAGSLIAAALQGIARSGGLEVGDRDVRYVDANFSPLSDESSATFGAVAILRDATERHRAEEDLRTSSRQKDEFLAMLAHELRNPLAPIRNATQILQILQGSDPRTAAATSIIARQTAHLAGLLDDLLDVARVTRGAVVLERENIATADIVIDAVEQAKTAIDSRHHELTISPLGSDLYVFADRKRLTQVLANLLINAAKYTPDGGRITIDCGADERQIWIAVTDTGIGIEPRLLGSIFDLFVQARRSPDRAEGGLGIGLALVKSLVQMHGGHVRAESTGAGQGSSFIIELPRSWTPEQAKERGVELPSPDRIEHSLRLMVVDDNEDAARTLGVILDAIGYRVDMQTDPRVALERARSEHPDVFILDIGMPHMDGYELARQIRALSGEPRPVLIALTGYGSPSDRERAQLAGFDHHFIKPVDAIELASLLEHLSVDEML